MEVEGKTMDREELAAMAIAAIAEESQTDVKRVRIISFEEKESPVSEDNQ